MGKLRLTYAGHLTDRVQDLFYGNVEPEGIDLQFLPMNPEAAFHRMTFNQEFEASEMSFSTYIARIARNECPYVAIPAFPSRLFRHSAIYVNRYAGIREPRDLIGKRVGVPEYQMTAALWVRGFLQHEYGVKPEDIREWVSGGLHNPGRKQMIPTNIPHVNITREIEKSLNDMLVGGELDALVTARTPMAFQQGHEAVVRLFPDYVEIEKAYYQKRRLFPIMHVVVLRKDVYEAHPWTAVSLYQAFEKAKNNCINHLKNHELAASPVSAPWVVGELEKIEKLMGDDLWPYGLEKNWNEIEAMCQYSYEQGISPRLVEPEELFASNVVNMAHTLRI